MLLHLSIDLTTWAKESATVAAGTSFSTLVAKVATTTRDVGKPVYTELGQTCLFVWEFPYEWVLLSEGRTSVVAQGPSRPMENTRVWEPP